MPEALDPVFLIAAAVSVGSGLLAVTRRNPIYSAVWLLVCFMTFAVLYLKLDATFLAAIHVLVYTGAILVLFIFVIMLLNLKPDEYGEEASRPARGLMALLCGGLFALLAWPMFEATKHIEAMPPLPKDAKHEFGSVETAGTHLFVDFGLPFELMSVLILVAIFGGVVLAKRKI